MSRCLPESFEALLVRDLTGPERCAFRHFTPQDLPPGDVTIRVTHTTLNYKDALALTGKAKVIKHYPIVAGIDLAGVVEDSRVADWQPGDEVLATGWGLGESHWGGYTHYTRLPASWLTRLPAGMTRAEAMTFGTAGFTAALCVMTLEERGVKPSSGPVLVTGASGGVGSIALSLLAARGFEVTAVTGRQQHSGYLFSLGAKAVLRREELNRPARPLESEQWAGAVDTVGGPCLATLLSQMRYYSTVAACGNAGSIKLETTVFPFILRAVSLTGVESVYCPRPRREAAWDLLAAVFPKQLLPRIRQSGAFHDLPRLAEALLAGEIRGRLVVELQP